MRTASGELRFSARAVGARMVTGAAVLALSLSGAIPAPANDNPALGIGEPTTPPDPPPPRGCGDIPCDGCDDNASPVFIRSGDLFRDFEDLSFGDGPLPFQITRRYNSAEDYVGYFGRGVHSSLDMMSIATFKGNLVDEVVVVRWRDGQRSRFTRQPNGTYSASLGKFDALVALPGGFEMTTPEGVVYTFADDTRLLDVADRNGNQITYAYDGSGRPEVVTLPDDRTVTVTYNASGFVDTISDFAGRTVAYEYDTDGFLTQFTDAGAGLWTLEYQAGKLTRIVDPLVNTALSVTYDAQGRVSRMIDDDGDFTYGYPTTTSSTKRDNATGGTWTYQYDSQGLVTRITDPLSAVSTRTYNAQQQLVGTTDVGGTTTYAYNVAGRMTSRTAPPGGGTTTFTYNALGLLETETDPLNVVTRYEYDTDGNLTRLVEAFGTALQRATLFAYDAAGNVLTSTDAALQTETYGYDAFNRLTSRTDVRGYTTTYAYDAFGRLTFSSDHLANETTLEYDSLGRMTRVTDALDNFFLMEYDAAGRQTRIVDREGRPTTYEYDALGRQTRLVNPLNHAMTFEYDSHGRLTRQVDPNGQPTTYARNAAGFVTGTTNALNQTTTFGVNARGNRTSLTDARSQVTTFTYNFRNQLLRTTYPGGAFEELGYNLRGDPITRRNRAGQTTQYQYDLLGRLTLASYPDATSTAYGYDSIDRLTSVTNAAAQLSLGYDAAGNLTSETNQTLGKTVGYAYDEVGQKTSMTDPQGINTTYGYDAAGNLTQVSHPAVGTVAFEYDREGRRTRMEYADGAHTIYAYDLAGAPLSIQHFRADASLLASFTQTYDPSGNVLTLTDAAGMHTYAYDAIHQLTAATHPNPGVNPNETYTYDPVGNRTASHLSASYTYDANNRLLQDATFTYTYDANGNLTRRTQTVGGQETAYAYDAVGHLVSVTPPGGAATTFGYDGLERRASRSSAGVTTHYVYDDLRLIAEYDTAQALVAAYQSGPQIDELLGATRGGPLRYHTDGLKSVASITDGGGAEVKSYTYDSFGRIVAQAGGAANAITFTGREHDPEAGLYHYRARAYDSATGRFLQPDPLGFAVSPNHYPYVGNNPVNYTDPLGLEPEYGNCCGSGQRCEPGGENCEEGPQDETDKCCNVHDRCLVGTGGATSCDEPSRQCHRELIDCWKNGPAANEGGFYRKNYRRSGANVVFPGILAYCKGKDAVDRVKDKFNDVKDKINDTIDRVRDGIDRVRDGVDRVRDFVDDVRDQWRRIRDFPNRLPIPRLGF